MNQAKTAIDESYSPIAKKYWTSSNHRH
jgi:hypothetical protein